MTRSVGGWGVPIAGLLRGFAAAGDKRGMESFAYRLQRLETGVVLLDGGGRVRALNPIAERLLGAGGEALVGREIEAVHPPAARGKLRWLLDAAREQDQAALVITMPGRTLLLKATRLGAEGICLSISPADDQPGDSAPPPLVKLPVSRGGGVALTPLEEVAYLRAEGHYTMVASAVVGNGEEAGPDDGFCPLALAELEERLDRSSFLRVHRSFIVNLRHATGVRRVDGRLMLATANPREPLVPVGRSRVEAVRRLFAV